MGEFKKNTWTQQLAVRLETPLTEKRAHQPVIYKAAHMVAMIGAYGWTSLALFSTLGWLGLPFYMALATMCNRSYRNYIKNHINNIVPAGEMKTSVNQTVSLVLPLSQDIGQTFMRHAGHANDCKVGFSENTSYCHIVSLDRKNYSVAISASQATKYHAERCNDAGMALGTGQFIREQAAVMAHEKAHMSRPRWTGFCNYSVMTLACLMATATAGIVAMTGLVALPAVTVAIGFGAAMATYLCGTLASRAEEYRADRGAVEEHGTAKHLAEMFTLQMPSLKRTFLSLCSTHPNYAQRCIAMYRHAEQLTPRETAAGALRMAKLYTEVAARHPHLFIDKPAEANPEGVLKPVRHATRAPA